MVRRRLWAFVVGPTLWLVIGLVALFGARARGEAQQPPALRVSYDTTTVQWRSERALADSVVWWTGQYAALIELWGWTLVLRFEPPANPYWIASTYTEVEQRVAYQVYDLTRLTKVKRDRWRKVIHELLHVSHAELRAFIWRLARNDSTLTAIGDELLHQHIYTIEAATYWPEVHP